MEILVSNQQSAISLTPEQERLLTKVCLHALEQEGGLPPAELSVVLVAEKTIRELNRDYRGVDAATDVLSFAQLEAGPAVEPPAPGEPLLLGDVVICAARALDQAQDYGHSLERELCYLAVHGIFHLLGYDHQSQDQQERMRRREEEVLEAFELVK